MSYCNIEHASRKLWNRKRLCGIADWNPFLSMCFCLYCTGTQTIASYCDRPCTRGWALFDGNPISRNPVIREGLNTLWLFKFNSPHSEYYRKVFLYFKLSFLAGKTELGIALQRWTITWEQEEVVTQFHYLFFHTSMTFYIVRGRLDKAPKDYWSHFEVFNIVIFLEVCSFIQLFPVFWLRCFLTF